MKKSNLLKMLGATVAVVGLGSFLVSTQTTAQQEKLSETADGQALVASKTNIVVGVEIFDKINTALEKQEKLSQATLDEYTWYMYQYSENPQYVSSEGSITTSDNGFVKLLELYKLSNIEPSFTMTDDAITFTRDIKEPKKADDKIDKAEEKVAEAIDDSKDESTIDIKTK